VSFVDRPLIDELVRPVTFAQAAKSALFAVLLCNSRASQRLFAPLHRIFSLASVRCPRAALIDGEDRQREVNYLQALL